MICEKHEKLVEEISGLKVRVDNLEDRVDDLDGIKEAITRLVVLQEEREKADIQRDKELKKQSEALVSLQNTLIKINNNLDALNSEVKTANDKITRTNERVEKLEEKFYQAEEKNKVDTRDILKGYFSNLFLKWVIPIGATATLVAGILKLFKLV